MAQPLIVVPLDTSELSEGALPYVATLAKATGARLLLVTVWEGAERALISDLPDVAEDIFRAGERHYEEYLTGVAKRLQADGIDTEAEVLTGDPDDEVLALIEAREASLLAFASHGRSGLGRWWFGSTAAQLARAAPVPTLVVGPKALETGPGAGAIRRILVPLDGSELAEAALAPAGELAEALGAEIYLVEVLRWAAQAYIYGVPQANIAQIDRDLVAAAQEYLSKVQARLPEGRVQEIAVMHGLPADALIDFTEEHDIDLVVMASHTRTGLLRAALGSVADRMLQSKAPVYLVRPLAPEPPQPVARPETKVTKGRYCHACGRAVPYGPVDPEERCLRCGQHLHACANCVYFDGLACLVQRPEVHDAYPGLNCPRFQFRETVAPGGEQAQP